MFLKSSAADLLSVENGLIVSGKLSVHELRLLILSDFFLSQNVFKSCLLEMVQYPFASGKRINIYYDIEIRNMLTFIIIYHFPHMTILQPTFNICCQKIENLFN